MWIIWSVRRLGGYLLSIPDNDHLTTINDEIPAKSPRVVVYEFRILHIIFNQLLNEKY